MQTKPSRRATRIGILTLGIWATFVLLATWAGPIPPLLMVAVAMAIGASFGLGWTLARGQPLTAIWRHPPLAWMIGAGGLFGYHFAYFAALRAAPPVEASLLNYLWPLLIVLFSALLPGEKLRWRHAIGAVLGFAGAALLLSDGRGFALRGDFAAGYALAVTAAVIWAAYSVLSRRFSRVRTEAVAGYCAAASVLALAGHLTFEATVWPQGWQWLAVIAIGLGPIGGTFYSWDYAVKHGDIQALGVFAYGVPLASTALLILFGAGRASWTIAAACILIAGGGALAGHDQLGPKILSFVGAAFWKRREL